MSSRIPSAFSYLKRAQTEFVRRKLSPTADERSGFAGGTRWMARSMGVSASLALCEQGKRAARWKYALSLVCGAVCALPAAWLHPLLALPAFALGFYACEVQGLFLLPHLISLRSDPFAASRASLRALGGTAAGLAFVIPVAGWMVFGSLFRGVPRAWCEGCLAVVLLFEELHGAKPPASASSLAEVGVLERVQS